MKKIFLLPFILIAFLFFSCGINDSEYGSVSFMLPSMTSRAATDSEEYTYKLTLTPSDNIPVEVEAKKGPITVESVRIGNCQIDAELYYGEAVVPMYSGSTSVYINPNQINKAELKLSKIDYSSTIPVGFNFKMAGGIDYCSNIHTNLSDLRIQRVWVDGSKDEEYISPLGIYEISFEEAPATTHSVGLYPIKLKGSNGFEKSIMLPVYYSIFKGIAKDDPALELVVSEYSKNTTSSNTDFSVSIDSFTLEYRSRIGDKYEVDVTPILSDAKWINDQEEEPIEGEAYNFKPSKTGTYKIHFETTVTAEEDKTSGCVVNEWLRDVDGKTKEITKEITRVKGDDVDLGSGSSAGFNVNFEYPNSESKFSLASKFDDDETGVFIYIIYDQKKYGEIDNTLYHYYWKLDGVAQNPVDDLTTLPVDENQKQYSGIYLLVDDLADGEHTIECFVKYPQGYIELVTITF